MERYTYFEGGKWRVRIGDTEYSGPWVDRLAAYEDTGLEPEDIKKAFNEEAVLKLAAQALGTTPECLRELVKAQDEGRFTAGDEVWVVECDEDGECEVSGYVFLAEAAGYAIIAPIINEFSDIDDIFAYAVESTAQQYSANFVVYPITDCYKSRTEAEAAIGGGGDG